MSKLSPKAIALLVGSTTLIAGGAIAIPVAVTLVKDQEASDADAISGDTIEVAYNEDLPQPAQPAGYASPVLLDTNYKKGVTVVGNVNLKASYRLFPDGTDPTARTKDVEYRVLVVRAQVRPTNGSITRSHVYGNGTVELPTDSEFPKREGTGYLDWNKNSPTWWWQDTSRKQITLDQALTLPVGSRFYALYSSLPDQVNFTGNSDTFTVNYSVVQARVTPVVINVNATVDYLTNTLPGGDTVLPDPGVGYAPWAGPEYYKSDGSKLTESELPRLPAGTVFTAKWVASLDRNNYFGAEGTYVITYTIKKLRAPDAPTQPDGFGSVEYGSTALPRITDVTKLPALPIVGWQSWKNQPDYLAYGADTVFTANDLATATAGTRFRAIYTAIHDTNYETSDFTYTVIYTVERKGVSPVITTAPDDTTSVVQGQSVLPTYDRLPDRPDGYLDWSLPTYTTAAGIAIENGTQLSALPAGTRLVATYTSTVDNNHTGPDSSFTVTYVIAPAP